jgi:hypothetical protein
MHAARAVIASGSRPSWSSRFRSPVTIAVALDAFASTSNASGVLVAATEACCGVLAALDARDRGVAGSHALGRLGLAESELAPPANDDPRQRLIGSRACEPGAVLRIASTATHRLPMWSADRRDSQRTPDTARAKIGSPTGIPSSPWTNSARCSGSFGLGVNDPVQGLTRRLFVLEGLDQVPGAVEDRVVHSSRLHTEDIRNRAQQLQGRPHRVQCPAWPVSARHKPFPGSTFGSATNIPIIGHFKAIAAAAARVEKTDRPI